jgi:thiol:disulfide interchange protein DsbA
MNCSTIDSLLDELRMPRLNTAERQSVAAHIERCGRCAGAVAVHEALACERMAEPPPELFASVLGQLSSAQLKAQAAQGRRRLVAVGAAAAIAVIALAAAYTTLDRAGVTNGDDARGVPSAAALPAASRFAAGREYEVLAGAAPLAPGADGIPVTAFFMYRCRPCYAVEPELERFREATLGRVALTRMPAVFDSEAQLHARAFYAAEALGKLDLMHAAFYDEIHVRGNRLATRAALAEFFGRFGIDDATFAATFDSPRVEASLQRALAQSRAHAIDATPALIVAGRYKTSPAMAGSALFAVVDELVASEAACQTRCDGFTQRRSP